MVTGKSNNETVRMIRRRYCLFIKPPIYQCDILFIYQYDIFVKGFNVLYTSIID